MIAGAPAFILNGSKVTEQLGGGALTPKLLPGRYVRLVIAPNTRMGSVEGTRGEGGCQHYSFRHGRRFDDTLPDAWVYEDEIGPWGGLTDVEVAVINTVSR